MELSEYHRWWKRQGGQELRRLLMERWDPIGVNAAPGAWDEYDGYRGDVMELLRSGASAEEISDYLGRIERENMGLGHGHAPTTVGDDIVRWYAESVARWEASPPTS
jgi:hypothetical protein